MYFGIKLNLRTSLLLANNLPNLVPVGSMVEKKGTLVVTQMDEQT